MFSTFPIASGISTVLWLIAIVVVSIVVWREHRANPMAGLPSMNLVLTKFQADFNTAVDIRGRASGLPSWLFALLRLEPEHQLLVTSSVLSVKSASLAGFLHSHIPLEKVSSTSCGYKRSILALAFAMLFGFGFILNLFSVILNIDTPNSSALQSDLGLAFSYLILSAIALLYFSLSKRIGIFVISGGHLFGLSFRRSVIENVSVDLAEAERVIALINARIQAVQPTSRISSAAA